MRHARGRGCARGMAETHKEGGAVDDGGFSLIPRVPTPSGGARACRVAVVAETGQIAYDQSGMPGLLRLPGHIRPSPQGAHARIASSARSLPCGPRLNGLMMGSAIPERR